MKTVALSLMIVLWIGFALLLGKIAVVTPVPAPGLANPIFHVHLSPGSESYFLTGLWAALLGSYLYTLTVWCEQRLERLQGALPQPARQDTEQQPPEVKRLKDAIRSGDPSAVRQYAVETALRFEDERWLTPYELAELYGNPAVMDAVAAAFRQHFGHSGGRAGGEPPNRFAVGRRYTTSRSPYLRIR